MTLGAREGEVNVRWPVRRAWRGRSPGGGWRPRMAAFRGWNFLRVRFGMAVFARSGAGPLRRARRSAGRSASSSRIRREASATDRPRTRQAGRSTLGVPVIVEIAAAPAGLLRWSPCGARRPTDGRWCFPRSARSPSLRRMDDRVSTRRDVAPVMGVMTTPMLVVGTPALAGDTLAAAVSAARACRRGPLGDVGRRDDGTPRAATGAGLERGRHTHVPYRGGPPALRRAGRRVRGAVLERRPVQLQYVREGRVKALAVGAPARLPMSFPQCPLWPKLGYPDANLAGRRSGCSRRGPRQRAVSMLNRVQCSAAGPCDPASSPCGRQPANGRDRGRFRGADRARARVWSQPRQGRPASGAVVSLGDGMRFDDLTTVRARRTNERKVRASATRYAIQL